LFKQRYLTLFYVQIKLQSNTIRHVKNYWYKNLNLNCSLLCAALCVDLQRSTSSFYKCGFSSPLFCSFHHEITRACVYVYHVWNKKWQKGKRIRNDRSLLLLSADLSYL